MSAIIGSTDIRMKINAKDGMIMKILMIEDNRSVCEMMSMFFKKEKWDATFAYDGEEAVEKFAAEADDWEMVLLDLNRRISPTVPIVILTARDSESDQVLGLEMGADDYVTKPFSPLTLIARIKALRRRVQLSGIANKADQVTSEFDIQTSHFKLNSKTREAYLNGNLISNLTPKEFDLLKTLASKPKQVFTRAQLLQLVWDYEFYGDERTVDAHIKKLRQKIEKVGPKVIQTVWGVGYKFDDSEADDK